MPEDRRRVRPRNIDEVLVRRTAGQAEITPSYTLFMAASGVLAAVGMLTNSVPVLIGSMVVAPLLPPLVLIAFAIAAGEGRLAARGFLAAAFGLGVAIAFAMLVTWFFNVTSVLPESANLVHKPLLEERVRPGWFSFATAIAAGTTGALATVHRKMDSLIGTVAALALVPAGAAGGIALSSGDVTRAIGGFVLLLVNFGTIVAMSLFVVFVTKPTERPEGADRPEDASAS